MRRVSGVVAAAVDQSQAFIALASSSCGRSARQSQLELWSLATVQREIALSGIHRKPLTDVTFLSSAGGDRASCLLATCSADSSACVFDLASARKGPLRRLRGHGAVVNALCEAAVGESLLLLTVGDDCQLIGWDLRCSDPAICHRSLSPMVAIARLPATGSADVVPRVVVAGASATLTALDLRKLQSPDSVLGSASASADGDLLGFFPQQPHSDVITGLAAAGNMLVSQGRDGKAFVFDVSPERRSAALQLEISAAAPAPHDVSYLQRPSVYAVEATGSSSSNKECNGYLAAVPSGTGCLLASISDLWTLDGGCNQMTGEHRGPVTSALITSSFLATCSLDGSVVISGR